MVNKVIVTLSYVVKNTFPSVRSPPNADGEEGFKDSFFRPAGEAGVSL
jgi:hypothetical protein